MKIENDTTLFSHKMTINKISALVVVSHGAVDKV